MIWEWISLLSYYSNKKQMVWIYTNNTFILGLTKEGNNQ